VKLILLLMPWICLSLSALADGLPPVAGENEQDVPPVRGENLPDSVEYEELRQKIAYGRASIAEVRLSLTEPEIGGLTNTLHALYSMRWHRGVIHLLQALWSEDRDSYPELSWEQIGSIPARIALASTINRIQVYETREYLEFIRDHAHDSHEFHRAQAVIALGLNGDPQDVPYIASMADGENHYVAQSAITALSLMNSNRARNAMITIQRKYRGTPRGDLLAELLLRAYQVGPEEIQDFRENGG